MQSGSVPSVKPFIGKLVLNFPELRAVGSKGVESSVAALLFGDFTFDPLTYGDFEDFAVHDFGDATFLSYHIGL